MLKKSQGFTIIELIVVIAIIAVLAGIVLVNVTQYVNKGKDAAAKANLDALLKSGSAYFDDPSGGNGTFNYFCTSTFANSVRDSLAGDGYTLKCQCDANALGDCVPPSTNTGFCASIKLKSANKYYCVDTSGQKEEANPMTCDVGGCSVVCSPSCD